MSFKHKFFLSFFVLLVVFLGLLFPFVSSSVQKIVKNSMSNRAQELVAKLLEAEDEEGLVAVIKDQKHYTFYRIALLDKDERLLHDSHTHKMMRPVFFPYQFTSHPEVQEALKTGEGYAEEYSQILGRKLIYVAKCFDFHNKRYVLRIAFPYEYIQELRSNFEFGFLLFSSVVLVLFVLIAAFIVSRLTLPIRQIIDTIRPFQQGKTTDIPKIQLENHPDDDFSQLAKTLNTHYKFLEMRKDFIANASHELKTPITIIQGFAETLHDNVTLPKETLVDISEKIFHSSLRMGRIIHNLLTLASIENTQDAQIAPCDLVELIETCKNTLQSVHTSAEVTIHYNTALDYTIKADEALLEIALSNLLENAAKYSKETPKIEVHIDRMEDFVKIAIKDNGIGIPENDLERIFERFFRVSKMQSKKIGGSGLGLSIVATIVEKHCGKISVESTLGKGSTFTIHIKEQPHD